MVVALNADQHAAEHAAQLAAVQGIIERMEAKGLDPRTFYYHVENRVIDLYDRLEAIRNDPTMQFMA